MRRNLCTVPTPVSLMDLHASMSRSVPLMIVRMSSVAWIAEKGVRNVAGSSNLDMSCPILSVPMSDLACAATSSVSDDVSFFDAARALALATARSTPFSRATRSFVAANSCCIRSVCRPWLHAYPQSSNGTPPSFTTLATCSCGLSSRNSAGAFVLALGDADMLSLGVPSASNPPSSRVSRQSKKSSGSSNSSTPCGERPFAYRPWSTRGCLRPGLSPPFGLLRYETARDGTRSQRDARSRAPAGADKDQ